MCIHTYILYIRMFTIQKGTPDLYFLSKVHYISTDRGSVYELRTYVRT